MPKDLLETELNYPPLNMSMQPRDLLEGQPFKTYNEQINDNISSDYGFTDDDKLIIGSIFTPEELDEIRKSKPMGLLEGIKKKGVWESVKEQGKEFWSQFKPVEAWQSVGKTMVDWKAAKEASEAKPDNETDEERRKRFEEVQKVMPNVKWEDFIKVKTNSVPNETYLREMLRDSYRDQIRGTTVSGMVGNILGEMPVFMAELYASGGTVSALKTGLKKAAPAMVKNAAEQTAKIAAKGKVANAAVKTTSLAGKASVMAAVSPTMLTKNYLDRKISGTIKATDKGNILLAEMDEKPYTTAAKSFMDTQVSIFSEQTGEAIVGAVGTAVKKVTSPVIAKFMASPKVAQARDAILREIRKFKPDLDMQKFMHDKLYYNGVLGEMSEERLEGVLRGVLQLNTDDERSTTDQILDALYPGKDQLLAELGAFTIAGSLPYASRAVKNMLSKKGLSEAQINEVLENKDQTEIDSIADELTTQERNAQLEETKRMNPDAADVTQYVFDTLYNAGISEKEATQAARVVTGYALAGAKATGMTPMEFFRQRFPKVQREQFADFQKQFEEKRAEAGFNPFELLINDKEYRKLEKKVEAERGPSLLAYLKSVGGLKDSGGELKSRDIRKGYPGLINNKKGLSLDDAALYAWEHGYLPSEADYSGEMGRPSIDTLLEAIDDEMRGDKHYSEQEESYAYKGLKEQLDWVDQLSHEMDLLGVDYSNMSVQEAEQAYQKASEEYMVAENEDIDEAEEERRAIMEIDGAEYIPAAQNPTDEWDDIPFQFAGEKAQTAALDELDNAKQLEADGVDNEEIRQQTGWFKGVDGKWRFEISDKDAAINIGFVREGNTRLGSVLKHENLYKAYPSLAHIAVKFIDDESVDFSGKHIPATFMQDESLIINLAKTSKEKIKSVLLHEIQHSIQGIEGFARGGSPATITQEIRDIAEKLHYSKLGEFEELSDKANRLADVLEVYRFSEKPDQILNSHVLYEHGSPFSMPSKRDKKARKEYRDFLYDAWWQDMQEKYESRNDWEFFDLVRDGNKKEIQKEYYRLRAKAKRLLDKTDTKALRAYEKLVREIDNFHVSSYDAYNRLYGEIEARNTETRMDYTEEERRVKTPESTQDVANADAIVVFDDGTAMAYKPETYYQSAFAGSRVDYDRPSLEAIGSGEGNQAHGYGLYYALKKNVAQKNYYDKFKKQTPAHIEYNGQSIASYLQDEMGQDFMQDETIEAIEKGARYTDNIKIKENLIDNLNKVSKKLKKTNKYDVAEKERIDKAIEVINKMDIESFNLVKPQLHEVDIPENPYLLDEQKSYKEQSDFVKEALQKAEMDLENPSYKEKIFDNREEAIDFYDSKIDEFEEKADGYQRFMPQSFLTKDGKYGVKYVDDYTVYGPLIGDFSDITGEGIYNRIAHRLGSQKAASQFIEKYGIKGITYEGRQDGRCFVIFNPDDVKVIQKFYQNAERGKGVAKGAYTGSDNVIHLFETADASTFMHETAHWFKRELRRFGTDRSREILKKVDAWENAEFAKRYKVELKDGYYRVTDTKGKTVYDNKFGTEKEATEYAKEELFARGFEQYLRTGKAPSSYLKEAFDAFMEWLKQIYRTVKSLDVDLNDEIEEVYAAMVGGKELDDYVYGAQETQATTEENAPAPQDDDIPFDMVYRDAVEEVKPTKQEVAEVVTTIKSAQDIAESIEPTTEEEQKGWWSGLYDIYNKVRTAVVGNEATAQSMEEYSEGWWSLFRRHFTDYLSGLEKIDADIYKRARVNAGLGGNIINALTNRVQRLDKNGNIEDLGEGLMPILKDFRAEFGVSMNTTLKDLGDYMIARRYLEDLQNREDVKVTDKQIEESLNKVDALKKKYSAQVIRFKEYAERIYDYQKRISHFLVDSELMTEEKWQDMINKNPNYIPFYRILEDNGMQTDSFVRPVTSNGFNRSHPTIKKIKGSELDIRSPFASIVNNTTNVLRNAYKNNVARAVADLKDVYPNLVREKKPLMEHGKVKMKVSFDKGLRDALLNGIEQLGAKFTKAKTLNQKGERGLVLGDYNPQEKLVRERLGVDNALTHEFGHLLDFELGLGRWIIDSTTRKELEKLAEERLHYETQAVEDDNGDIRFERVLEQEPTPKFDAYIKNDREIIANLYDAYINAPEMLDKIAPKAKKKLEQALDKSGYKWLKDIKRTLDKGIEEIEQDAWVKSNVMPSGNTISYRQKGVKKYIEVHKKLYTALNGIDKSTRYPTIKAFFTIPEKILRLTTTTWSAAFTVRNMIRDTMEASINTNVGFMPIISTLRGMYDVVTKSDVYKDWMASGGSFDSFMEVNENSERNPYEELFGNISKWKYINPLKWIEAFGNLGEQATRVSIYRLAKQKGRSDIDASILSRGSTVDFARGGDWAKVANQYSAFLNAGIQGTSAMLQAFKERPVQTTIKALAYITLPSILETGYYLYMAPDDDREEYLELPSWRKDLFWNFKVGDLWFMLPKPFTYGMVFGTIPQAMMIADYKNEDTDWKHLFEETLGTMNPLQDFGTYFPKLIKELIEQQLNKDFYTDRQIVPFFMEKRDPEFQYTDNTSDLAKEVGKIIGYSPAKIEHAVTSIFGTLSKDLMAAYDLWSNDDGVAKEWGELPVVRGFVNTQPIGNRSQSVQDYYDLYNDAYSAYTTYNGLKKESKEKAEEYAKENKSRLNLYEHLKPYEKRRKEIAQEIKYIRNNDSMAPQAKKDAIDYLNKEMTANAREALKLKKDDAVLNETTEDRIKYNLWGTRNKVLADDSVIKEIARLNELEIRPTMTDPTETTKLSYLNNEQRKEARQKYADAYNAVVSQIIRTPEYRNAKDKEKKDMINKVRTHIVNLLKKEYKVK